MFQENTEERKNTERILKTVSVSNLVAMAMVIVVSIIGIVVFLVAMVAPVFDRWLIDFYAMDIFEQETDRKTETKLDISPTRIIVLTILALAGLTGVVSFLMIILSSAIPSLVDFRIVIATQADFFIWR